MAAEIETYRGTVYPWHCDQMGHLNVQHYVGMYDQASVHLFSAIGVTPSRLQKERVGFADVKHVIEYRDELAAGAAVHIRSRVTRLGTSSIGHLHTMRNSESGAVAATFDMVSVLFDLEARKAIPFPGDIRAKAEALMAD